MDDKKFVIIVYSGMGILLTGLIVFLYISIRNNSKKNYKEINYNNIKTLNPDDKIFSSKSEAYAATDKDSFLSVRKENVNVDFSRLFKDDTGDKHSQKIRDHSDDNTSPKKLNISKENIRSYNEAAARLKSKTLSNSHSNTNYSSVSVYSNVNSEKSNSSNTSNQPKRRDGFYSASTVSSTTDKPCGNSSLRAVIHTKQEAYQGSTVKMRTVTSITINGSTIPTNTFIYGIANMGQERVKIKVSSIIYNNQLFKVDYSVFDRDGIEGIYVPGLVLQDVANETSKEVVQNVDLNVPYVGNVPVNVARKKIEQQKALLTDGYEVILKN